MTPFAYLAETSTCGWRHPRLDIPCSLAFNHIGRCAYIPPAGVIVAQWISPTSRPLPLRKRKKKTE